MKPRPYQEEMLSCAIEKFREKKTVLIQAATGAGKTVVFADLIRRFLNDYPSMRILVLVHREIIVSQNADKLRRIWPSAPIGIACASVSGKINMTAPVVFGSVQTLASRISELPLFHLVIVDEAHRLPPKTKESQYQKVLNRLLDYYANLRIFGLTATPFRLAWGPIYGTKHKRLKEGPTENWFDDLDMEVGILRLQKAEPDDENPDAPYLCDMRVFVEDKTIETDLSAVTKTAGEYNQGALSDLMQKTVHLQTALTSYRERVGDRKRCVIFAVDISHADRLVEIFSGNGIISECVHSEKEKEHNRSVLRRFDDGEIPVVVNVGVLTEGWDCRSVDMLMLCRPTMSAALFVQIVGRGLRTFPGKQNVLIIDLAGCFNKHGHPAAPIMPSYDSPGRPKEREVIPDKKCPECGFLNKPNTWCCADCGAILKVKQIEEAKAVKLRELNLDRIEKKIEFAPVGNKGKVTSMIFSRHITQQGNICLKVAVSVALERTQGGLPGINLSSCGNIGINACHFYRFDGPGAWHFQKFWKKIAPGLPIPADEEAAIHARHHIVEMPEVVVVKDGKYWKVNGW